MHESDGPTASPIFHSASRSPRLLETAQPFLADDALYIYHTKCNLKTAIDGSVWQWHQDFGSWKRDGVPEPRLTTALIMLDEPTEIGGCLYFIPGNQRYGNLEPQFNEDTGYKFFVVPKPQLLDIMNRSPEPVPIISRPGTLVFLDCNIIHAWGHNLSRHDRAGRSMWCTTRSPIVPVRSPTRARTTCARPTSRRSWSEAMKASPRMPHWR